MKDLHRYLLSCLVLLFFASCGQSTKEITGLLTQAEAAIEQQPDSALRYLKAIQDPDGLREERRMNFYLLWVQAKDKTGGSISADTIIGEVKDYFVKQEAWEKAARAAFYCGRVYSDQQDTSRAMHAYMNADTIAQRTSDIKRKGLIQHNIGGLYYDGGVYDNAIAHLKRAANYFYAGDYYKYRIESLNVLSSCFLVNKQTDSALFYQQQALIIADTRRDTATLSSVFNNLGVTYRKMGDYSKAKTYVLQALQLHPATEKPVNMLLNVATIYYNLHQTDSAAFYANRVIQLCENDSTYNTPASVYALLAKIEKTGNRYKKALEYTEAYTRQVLAMAEKERTQIQSLSGLREKYELELAQNEVQQLKNRYLWLYLIASLSLSILLGLTLYFYRRYSRHKIKLLAAEQKNQQNRTRNLEIITALATFRDSRNEKKVQDFFKLYHKIIHRKESNTYEWDDLYYELGTIGDPVPEQIRTAFPALNDTEFRICVLLYIGCDDRCIATILGQKTESVYSRISDIRKKLGIEKQTNIAEFLMKKAGETASKTASGTNRKEKTTY
jgi:tetratricopeptide (TPR) repeat protein/DNA-binding CsgD family transcriptional regulator